MCLSALKLFDQQSRSTLREVLIKLKKNNYFHTLIPKFIVEVLMESNETLEIVRLDTVPHKTQTETFSDLSWNTTLPKLRNFRITSSMGDVLSGRGSMVRLTESDVKLKPEGIKVLWIYDAQKFHYKFSVGQDLDYLNSLTSFSVLSERFSREWRSILDRISKNLKHLRISLRYGF